MHNRKKHTKQALFVVILKCVCNLIPSVNIVLGNNISNMDKMDNGNPFWNVDQHSSIAATFMWPHNISQPAKKKYCKILLRIWIYVPKAVLALIPLNRIKYEYKFTKTTSTNVLKIKMTPIWHWWMLCGAPLDATTADILCISSWIWHNLIITAATVTFASKQ